MSVMTIRLAEKLHSQKNKMEKQKKQQKQQKTTGVLVKTASENKDTS